MVDTPKMTPAQHAQLQADADAVGNTASLAPKSQAAPQARTAGRRADPVGDIIENYDREQAAKARPAARRADPVGDLIENYDREQAAEARRHATNAERVARQVRVAMAEGNDQPENLLPPGFNRTPRSTAPAQTPRRDGPSPEFLEAMAPLMRSLENQPSTPNEASVQRITNAIPGAVFGPLSDFNERVRDGHIYEEQHTAFMRGGKALMDELAKNPQLRQKFGTSMNSTNAGRLDLDGDRSISPEEYAAHAAVLDEKRTANRPLKQIANELGNALDIDRARQILTALHNPPAPEDAGYKHPDMSPGATPPAVPSGGRGR